MKYYYIHPFRPQYFFPKGFKKHAFFLKFFIPYSLIGKISWFLFNTIGVYRAFFSKKNIETSIPEASIRSIIGKEPLMAFNTGTLGPEQKITALGVDNDFEFFIKYGQTVIAKENVRNENFILKQLSHLDFVPKVLDFYSDHTQVLLKTNVLNGERLLKTTLDHKIIKQLITIANQKVECIKTTHSSLKASFAHGDFCPWNMMLCNNELQIFDWEMGNFQPVGYDLFTYMFQTSFLLTPYLNSTSAARFNLCMMSSVKKVSGSFSIALPNCLDPSGSSYRVDVFLNTPYFSASSNKP